MAVRRRNEGYLVGVARHHFAVDHRFVRQPGEGLHDGRILAIEALVVGQMRYAVRFEGERPVAVEFQPVKPVRSFGKPLGAKEQHGLDESSFGPGVRHRGLDDWQNWHHTLLSIGSLVAKSWRFAIINR